MSKKKTNKKKRQVQKSEKESGFWTRLAGIEKIGIIGVCLLLVVGVLAGTGAFSTDSTGSKGSENSAGLLARLNPFSSAPAPMPSPTPQLSKEYIYAGSRLVAVEDANATASPPGDLAIWRPSSGTWWVFGGPGSQQTSQGWGASGDVPAPGDYDGDGKTDFCVYRPSTGVWYVMKSSGGSDYYYFGLSTDLVASADFDGDGQTDAALYRKDQTSGLGTWYIRESSSGQITSAQFGLDTDVPAPHDYDGDGTADLGVWRDSTKVFYSLNSSTLLLSAATFSNTGTPVSGDYDGDGRADYAIRNGANWHILHSSTNTMQSAVSWQQAGDKPVQNDYDGDGKVDIAVWRESNGNWYIRNSSDLSLRQQQWGTTGDIPVPAFYRR